jgi:hypothetical protein
MPKFPQRSSKSYSFRNLNRLRLLSYVSLSSTRQEPLDIGVPITMGQSSLVLLSGYENGER